jgi:hypothetical protein
MRISPNLATLLSTPYVLLCHFVICVDGLVRDQGDQIGRIFAYRASVFLGLLI